LQLNDHSGAVNRTAGLRLLADDMRVRFLCTEKSRLKPVSDCPLVRLTATKPNKVWHSPLHRWWHCRRHLQLNQHSDVGNRTAGFGLLADDMRVWILCAEKSQLKPVSECQPVRGIVTKPDKARHPPLYRW
jgi:hypothetical protein